MLKNLQQRGRKLCRYHHCLAFKVITLTNQFCLTRVTANTKPVALDFWIKLEFRNVSWGKPEYPEKNLSEQGENQQQTQPTYDAGSRNCTQATLVRGERSHHCATLALKNVP